MNYRFITIVWGDDYVEMLVKMAIPNQLSPGNLPGMPNLESSKYVIYATSRDAETIRRSDSFSRLSEVVPVEFLNIDDIDFSRNKYGIVTECTNRDLRATESEDVAYVYLYPDVLWSDGSYRAMAKITGAGKRAILTCSISANRDTAFEAANQFFSPEEGSLSVTPRQLVRFTLDHLDPYTEGLFWESSQFDRSPAQIYWTVKGEGLLMRGFPLGPFMVRPKSSKSYFAGSVDGGEFLRRAGLGFDDIHVVVDSDEMFHVSLAPPPESNPPNRARPVNVARWAAKNTIRHQRRFFEEYRIRAHYTDMSPAWEEIEAESDKTVNSVRFFLRFQLVFLLQDWKGTLGKIRWALRHSRLGNTAFRWLRLGSI